MADSNMDTVGRPSFPYLIKNNGIDRMAYGGRNMRRQMRVLLMAVVALVAMAPRHTAAQVSVNVAYVYQEHTFAYRNGMIDSLRQDGAWMKGGMAGLSLTVPFIGRVGITPGIYLTFAQLNEQMGDSLSGITNPTTSNLNIKMPFFFSYSHPLSMSTDLIVFGGPVFNLGLSSLANYRNTGTQIDAHFDMGGTVAVGIQFHRVRVFLGYNASLIDRDDFDLANKQSLQKAWEGSTLFVGAGLSLGRRARE